MGTSKEHSTTETSSAIPHSTGETSRGSSSFAQATLDALPAHICVLDEQGTIISTNRSWNRFADENPPAPERYAVGVNYLSLCDKASGRDADGARDVAAGIRSVMHGDVGMYQLEYPCHAPDAKRWFTMQVTRVIENDRIYIIIVHNNVTEYRQAWVTQVDSDDEFVRIFDDHPAMMMLIDVQTRTILNVNRAYCRLMGYSKEEVLNIPGKLGFTGVDREEVQSLVKEVQEKDRIAGREMTAVNRNGERITGILFVEPVDIHSRHYHTLTFIDITHYKQAEQALIESESRYHNLFDHASIGIFHSTPDGKFLRVNRALARMLRYDSPEEMISQVDDIESQVYVESKKRAGLVSQTLQEDWVFAEDQYWRKDRSVMTAKLSVRRVPKADGTTDYLEGFVEDITERKQVERTLREFEARFSTIFYSSPMPMALANLKDNVLVNVNQAWLDETGYQPEDIVGKSSSDLNLLVDPAARDQVVERLQKNQKVERFELRMRRKSGEIIDILMSAEVIDLAGEPYMVSMALDITERKRAEEKLRSSEEQYRQAISAAGAVPYYRDYQKSTETYTFMGEGILQLTGYSADEITPELFDSLGQESIMRGSLSHLTMEEAGNLSEAGKISHWVCDYRLKTRDGDTRWIADSAVQVRDENNRRVGVIGILQDITERKEVEIQLQNARRALEELNRDLEERVEERTEEVRHREAVYRALFENSNDGIFLLNEKGENLDINQHALNMLGYTREEYRVLPASAVIPANMKADSDAKLAAVFRGEYIPLYERTLIGKEGRTVEVEVNLSPVRDAQGNIIMVQSVVRDISERKKAEERLRESRDQLSVANAALEKALRAKDEFLASMSHELRTPLTSILGLSETLQMKMFGDLNAKQTRYVTTIERSGRHLLELINDILDLSKIEAGKLSLQFEPCHLEDICQSSIQLTRGMANQKSQTVHFSIDPHSIIISADERRLKQMIVNLLSNAIKFTPENSELGLDVKGSDDEKSVWITVWDRGIGIQQEDMSRLFQPFVQLSSGLNRGQGGTGLGLALVSEMARMHGGSVHVDSEPGEGSRFTITLPWLPIYPSDPSTTVVHEPSHVNGRAHILLVEDTESVIMVVEDYLISHGFTVSVANNGMEGINMARQVHPDLILMDLQMPVMSGLEATQYLRGEPEFQKTPIIALTALAMPGDRERSLQAGMNDYISKPIQLRELVKTIESYLSLDPS